MTDVTQDPVPEPLTSAEHTAATEPPASETPSEPAPQGERKGPGRPRVPEVVQRDEAVFAYLQTNGPSQVRDIAAATGNTKNASYLSLWRLRKAEKVQYSRTGARRLWSITA